MAHVHVVRHVADVELQQLEEHQHHDDIPLIQRSGEIATRENPYRGNEWNDTRGGRNYWFHTASSHPRPSWLQTLDSINCNTKQLTYLTIYLSAIIFTTLAIILYILPNYECNDVNTVDKQDINGQHPHYLSFGRVWLSIMMVTEAMGQWWLAKSIHFSHTDSQDVRYLQPDSPHSFRAWLAFGITQCARLALIYDILSIGETRITWICIFTLVCNTILLIWYYLHPFKYGLKVKSAFITYMILSLELSAVLFYAYHTSDPTSSIRSAALYAIRSPIALLGAGLCQLWYALQLFPLSLLVPYDPWILETSNIIVWILMFVCYRAFENCV